MATVIQWAEASLGVPVGTYPQKDMPTDFAIVQRVGGSMSYPHDAPRYSVQLWTDDDASGEQVIMALARLLPTLKEASGRINGIDPDPEVTQLGHVETGHFVWQLTFQLYANIRDDS
jgi:hypothetical protein